MKTYLCIDLKTFYASVECAERGLDPFKTNLAVCDLSRGRGAICLAISPKLKAMGIRNRCRAFEIPKDVEFIAAKPRMALYIKYSADIYGIYLRYLSKDDIYVYSIDEAFLDVTSYLKLYKMDAFALAKKIMADIFNELHITATCGIGTNLYLAKIALDITAKHINTNIAYLDEELYQKTLWHHTPLTDFWRIGEGTKNRLLKLGIHDMEGITKADPAILKKTFGVDYVILLDHAYGVEPTTISDIKKYESRGKSISQGQILFEDYNYKDARLVVKEMVDILSLEMVDKGLVTNQVSLMIRYSKDMTKPTGGGVTIPERTNVYSILSKAILDIYDRTTNPIALIRGINISFNNVMDSSFEEYDLFTDTEKLKEEKRLEETINSLKKKYGKNSILRGMNFEEKATTRKRNLLIGGHNSGEEE